MECYRIFSILVVILHLILSSVYLPCLIPFLTIWLILSNSVQSVTYTFTPIIFGVCPMPDIPVTIFVNPSPTIEVTVANDTICDEGTATIEVNSLTGLTSGLVKYDYTIEDVSGLPGDVTGQTEGYGEDLGSFNQTLDNHTDQVQWVEYRIHPFTEGTGSGVNCDYGDTRDSVFKIYVIPIPGLMYR